MAQAAQGGGGVTIPVVLQNRGDVAQRGSDGVGLVVDLVILVVFSSLKWLLRAVSASSVDGPWEASAAPSPISGVVVLRIEPNTSL